MVVQRGRAGSREPYGGSPRQVDSDKPVRNFLDDPRRSGPAPDLDRKEGSRRHVRNWGGLDFDNVKIGGEPEREWTVSGAGGGLGFLVPKEVLMLLLLC